ncbi:coiled-coil domain-containing protein 50-like isoform X5 [Conger conger]|uniref:coiled-coil domain-containing protein 50-like isoform X5 n=1 Tax=Conger conger TaxID=82655 RepID=UPI002A5AB734|nr:coiled-coil domain-containing protein 50-like isoform X5 [Conger conger]
MMELDIDQSHLPRVQEAHSESAAVASSVRHTTTESGAKELCQGFAVLEDGALAYNLQEQEIEQFYSSNVQKSQLVQNDIRMAKQLQDEEELRANRIARQIEERDSEYARMIQEELQRCAEDARRREEEDEEMAKRLQEEEEMDSRRQRLDSGCHGDVNDIFLREGVTPRRDGASLELSELGQVLQDEELARKLQEEEERLLRKSPPAPRDPQASSPRGDFRAAQVAQDEEIARFMQRSEKKAQRRSCDLEGQGSRRDQRDPDNGQERSARETTMELPQGPRQRLDSQGLNSPTEDLSPDCQPPSPNCVASQLQAVRNIAEELDPTFKAKRRDSNPAGQSSSGLSTSPSSPSGLHDHPQEPTFVPPTKRQSDKSSRPKAKEKKESCKQQ